MTVSNQYHCSFKIVRRSGGGKATAASAYVSGSRVVSGSVVAGAAYRAGEKIHNEYDNTTYDYTRKSGVAHSERILPENASKEYNDSSSLWNAVEKKNKRKDAQLARECDIALPKELTLNQQIDLVREYVTEAFVNNGSCVDFAIHDKDGRNPHAHIMFTMDEVTEKGFGKRLPDEKADKYYAQKERLINWRKTLADVTNKHLEKAGLDIRVDYRSYKDQGTNKIPMIHLGKAAHQMEKKGVKTRRGDRNRETVKTNKNIRELIDDINKADRYITALKNYETEPAIRIQIDRISAQNARRIEYVGSTIYEGLEKLDRELKIYHERTEQIKKKLEALSPLNNDIVRASILESEMRRQKAEKTVDELKQKRQQRNEPINIRDLQKQLSRRKKEAEAPMEDNESAVAKQQERLNRQMEQLIKDRETGWERDWELERTALDRGR